MSLKVAIIRTTPKLIDEWLEAIPVYQRKVDDKQVKKLLVALERDEWRDNGATIVFNTRGELLNGLHRLTALKLWGKPVQLIVVTGVEASEEVFHTIDDAKARKVTDFLRCANTNVTASVGRFLWMVENKVWPPSKMVVPHVEILKTIKKHEKQISGSIEAIYEAGKLTGQTSFCVFLAIYYTKIRRTKKPEKVANFFARVGDGLELHASDPEYQLRRRFTKLAHGQELTREAARAIILKALNMRLTGEPCTVLRFEPKREQFPMLIGLDNTTDELELESVEEEQADTTTVGEPRSHHAHAPGTRRTVGA